MLETRQTGDVLAGQDRRLRQLFQTDRARNAEPAQHKTPDQFSAPACAYVQIIKKKGKKNALVMKGVQDPDQLLQCYQTLHIR